MAALSLFPLGDGSIDKRINERLQRQLTKKNEISKSNDSANATLSVDIMQYSVIMN